MGRILIVDDRPLNREFLVMLLSFAHHHLHEAGDGAKALKVAKANSIDLIITDILMPIMDGVELVENLNKNPKLKNIPVIFYTATHLKEEAKSIADACGVKFVLEKPCEPQIILDMVHSILEIPKFSPNSRISDVSGSINESNVSDFEQINSTKSSKLFKIEPIKQNLNTIVENPNKLTSELDLLMNDIKRLSENLNQVRSLSNQLVAILEFNLDLISEPSPEKLLDTFCKRTQLILGVEYAILGILNEDEQNLKHFIVSGKNAQYIQKEDIVPHLNKGLIGQILKQRSLIKINDGLKISKTQLFPHHPPISQFMGLPIISKTNLFGFIYYANKIDGNSFREEEYQIAQTLVSEVSMLYENFELNNILQRYMSKLHETNKSLSQLTTELQEKEEQLNCALQVSEIGTWIWDCIKDENILNDNAMKILGLHHNEEIPKNPNDFFARIIHPDDRERMQEEFNKTMQESAKYDNQFRIVRPDNSERIIISRGGIFVDENNVPLKMFGVILDITEKEASKKHLFDLTKDLERSNKKLATSNERLQEFAYVASHDLQEPLRMVSNFVQLLQKRYKDKLDKDATDYIQFAVSGTERMKTLINDLLSYSRVDFQGKPLKEINMQEVLNLALANLQSSIKISEVEISFDTMPQVLGDSTQLEQLWQNLIVNAIRYQELKRPIKIQVGFTDQGKIWKFFVKDNGIGIDPQFHDRIFKVFQRLHRQEEYSGTGIGLSICQRVVERHGGKIWVESKLDEGSTFYFTLPKITI